MMGLSCSWIRDATLVLIISDNAPASMVGDTVVIRDNTTGRGAGEAKLNIALL